MKKSIFLFFATLLCAATLTACSGSKDSTEPTTVPTAGGTSVTNPTATNTPGITEVVQSSAVLTLDCEPDSSDAGNTISDLLYGIFLEDINHAVDGGMYAELIKNRSFEYGTAAANGNRHGWTTTDSDVLQWSVANRATDGGSLNEENPNYAVLTNTSSDYEGIGNVGYLSGMSVIGGEEYLCTLYAKSPDGYSGALRIALESSSGEVYAEGLVPALSSDWYRYEVLLTPSQDASSVRLMVELTEGTVWLDMVSLMPVETYKNTGVRKDIGEYLEALNPSFLRFPGGCVVEGKTLASMYSWKDSIGNGMLFSINGEETTGDIATRPQGQSIWNGTSVDPYYTTYGLGFYEYFSLCEALDCEAVPILNAGMTCPVQSSSYIVYPIGSEEFQASVQDALDLVEFCRGGADTYWGSVRIAMGHEEPFLLHYIGIGNEQWQSEYHAHYDAFVAAFAKAKKNNPELFDGIELIVANGPLSGDRYGWNYLEDYPDDFTTLVDEHYYEAPSWFLSNTKRYDSYDRDTQAKVFLGEYAAQSNTLHAALAEAAFMTGLERNADIVQMACYAPLFGNGKVNQWTPDLIWYNSKTVYGSINYYVQKLFSNNVGTTLLESSVEVSDAALENTLSGAVGLGSWQTKCAYDNLLVSSNDTGEILYQCDFSSDTVLRDDNWDVNAGSWSISDGRLLQSNTGAPDDETTGDAIYVGDPSWSNYTMTVEAEILSGAEGFLIPICVENSANNIFWNLGGWGNTVSCFQIVSGGSKSGQISGTVKSVKLNHNQVYQIKVVVQGNNIKCYLNDSLYVDYTVEAAEILYQTASVDAQGDIILKLVNVQEQALTVQILPEQFDAEQFETEALLTTLSGNSLSDQNSFAAPEHVLPVESTVDISSAASGAGFELSLPKYSLTVVRIKRK